MNKLLVSLFLFGCFASFAQTENAELKVYTFSEIEKIHQQKPKPIVVFTYTNWCKFCFGMKKNTFKNNVIIQQLNKNFYFVMLNAESKKDITFLGKKFVYKPSSNTSGTHQLATALASINGKISYPTTTILNSNFEIDLQIDSYISSKKMDTILKEYLRLNIENN